MGGGFNTSGIHNTLEAAVYGKPVIFGPVYKHFAEAVSLIKNEGAITYKIDNELINIIQTLLSDKNKRAQMGEAAAGFVRENTGATGIIAGWIRKNAF